MTPLARCLALIGAGVLCCATATAQVGAPADTRAARFDAAMQAYEIQHFQQAYESLVQLADEGHAEAARIALLMARHGRELYGFDWRASSAQRQSWARIVVAAR